MEFNLHALSTRLLGSALVVSALAGILLAFTGTASAASTRAAAPAGASVVASAQDDDTVVLPTRVAAAIARTQTSLDKAAEHIDEGEYAKAVVSLRALKNNMYRADRAARAQMNAPAPAPGEEGGEAPTPGHESVVEVL